MAEVMLENMEELEYAAEEVAEPYKCRTNMRINVRKTPSLEAEVVKILEKGEEVMVYEVVDGWGRMADGYSMVKYLERV